MKLTISENANNWFKNELELHQGDAVRFSGKLYGKTEVHDNFSVGLRIDQPQDVLVEQTIDGVTYFIEKFDDWFFNGYDFNIEYDNQNNDIIYRFIEN
ncbi:HesB/YadR/YfhF family protein [Oceanobacillus halophilus]|uniref:Iron-sulfur cluster biosynthesis protein n=1 Tax=Oceanobacillus halophilus TaxID=930130 RepID=A0A494ZWS0_9BACI|nr:iron-sulfur cluster biosynthesis protein [Oceanobacillus halophilus]RKQ30514.1 iron-sulfur cluster biosynthesis protein [Oceanobacillus halophilus]